MLLYDAQSKCMYPCTQQSPCIITLKEEEIQVYQDKNKYWTGWRREEGEGYDELENMEGSRCNLSKVPPQQLTTKTEEGSGSLNSKQLLSWLRSEALTSQESKPFNHDFW
jgi:hypothetical protein